MILKYFFSKSIQRDREQSSQPEAKGQTHCDWPVRQDRQPVYWFPAKQRLIGLVRTHKDGFVLPPAVVRKATWQE